MQYRQFSSADQTAFYALFASLNDPSLKTTLMCNFLITIRPDSFVYIINSLLCYFKTVHREIFSRLHFECSKKLCFSFGAWLRLISLLLYFSTTHGINKGKKSFKKFNFSLSQSPQKKEIIFHLCWLLVPLNIWPLNFVCLFWMLKERRQFNCVNICMWVTFKWMLIGS